jgi:hypothetical protein
MKTILPVTSWVNGQSVEAKVLNAYVINDNLISSATFYYVLFSENQDGTLGAGVAQGNLVMTGEAYSAYGTNPFAWDWVASTLKLTITGDYVPPTPTPDTSGTSGTSGTNGTSGTSGI